MKRTSPFICIALLFFAVSVFAEEKKPVKVITINNVRIMEISKKENKAQYRQKASETKPETAADEAPKTRDAAPPPNTEETGDSAAEEKKDDIIVFLGGVSISVQEGLNTSTIKADKIIFNRSENTMEASGSVHYARTTGSAAAEEFIGELFLFNIDEMEGVFLNGTVKQPPRKSGENPFIIHSPLVGRDSSGTTGFKHAALTTGSEIDDDPLWSIRASRIWLLPGNELAFANGYFSVGVVPLFYIPFFYHPADEMLFHPVFGFRNREGYFLQTTTYLMGRKPLDTESGKSSSFSNFMKTDRLKKQKRIGLFFKNLDEDETDTSLAYIKLVADAYSHLGGVVGVDGKFIPKNSPVRQVDFSLFFGMSRTLYPSGSNLVYTSYDINGKRHYNRSILFGYPVPFRYRAHFNMNISKDFVNFSINLPLISDPYFKNDFFHRSEDMNWFSYLLNRDKLALENERQPNKNAETAYSWRIDGSIRPPLQKLNPWITSFAIDSASLLLDFGSKNNTSIRLLDKSVDPHRQFFYPRVLKPETRLSIAGTLLSNTMFIRTAEKKEKKTETGLPVEGIPNPFEEGKPDAPSDTGETPVTGKEQPEQEARLPDFTDILLPSFTPVYGTAFDHDITYAITYNGNFTALQETTFASSLWNTPSQIKWSEYDSRYYQLNGSAGIKGNLSYSQNLLSLSSSMLFTGNYQRHPWVRDAARLPVLELNNFKANVYTLKQENTAAVNPFVHTELFKPVSFSWQLSEILLKNVFTGTYHAPKWETRTVKWDKDFITAHSGSAVFGVVLAEKYTQKLTFSTNLPPLLQAYTGSMSLSFPYGTFNMSARLFEKEKAAKKWYWDPLKTELSWQFPYDIKSAQTYIYNIEDKESDRLHITFGWKYLSAFYTQSREIPYKLQPGIGWTPRTTVKQFIPFETGFSFTNTAQPFTLYAWKNRIKIQFGLDSRLHFNLVRITDSYFTFAPKLIFNIHEFWDLSFGSSSRNDVIARYFQSMLNLPIPIPGNTNVFTDLAQSFYFWDRKKRQESGFKLQSLNIGLTHHLKDWQLKFTCDIKPQVKKDGLRSYYVFEPTITFSVEWKPIGDLKVTAKKQEGVFSVERGELK